MIRSSSCTFFLLSAGALAAQDLSHMRLPDEFRATANAVNGQRVLAKNYLERGDSKAVAINRDGSYDFALGAQNDGLAKQVAFETC
ncbi:hypothetical protein [uncultured Litoreibacter sp.]|uniref:hypothetical protein n=1 Tax=uncultured Litoreibacter sp. TaxID=1392394 RepID=UPI002615D811|nr:hypothetical protein [uncultured Litoreibacter sp.]